MSLRKRCDEQPPTLTNGSVNPLYCATSPRCEHHWHYDFRVNRRRYRGTTETADKGQAKNIEAKERSRILDGKHSIRKQPDITFREFSALYLKDYAKPHKRSWKRDEDIIASLNRWFGSVLIGDITPHRILQWQSDRQSGTWRAHGQKTSAKPLTKGGVDRELDTLRSIFSAAIEWRKLAGDNPCRSVKRLLKHGDNRRTRILTDDEQERLLAAAPPKTRAIIAVALYTGARIGEVLALEWADATDDSLLFRHTKNGKPRRISIGPSIRAGLNQLPKSGRYVFMNARTNDRYTTNGVRHVFRRAVVRAGIADPASITPHTLRHTALSRMIGEGHSDHTVMALSGHSSTRMLERYVHPSQALQVAALETGAHVVTTWSQMADEPAADAAEFDEMLGEFGGRQEDRTPDLSVANAALSQLS